MTVAVQRFAIQDRTQEFRSCITSLSKLNNSSVASSRQGLLDKPSSKPRSSKSEFTLRASSISKDIAETTAMLQKLALLAQRKTLFDDKPVEISELTFVIKQKVSQINQNIASLMQFVKTNKLGGDKSGSASSAWGGSQKGEQQLAEHANKVVVSLQGKLTDVTTSFEEVLEVRLKNIQASKNRTEHFISSSSSASMAGGKDPIQNFNNMDSPLYSTQHSARASPSLGNNNMPAPSMYGVHGSKAGTPVVGGPTISENPYAGALADSNQDYLALPDQQQSLALLEEQSQGDMYLSQRSNAVEAIESTIQELGGIFQQLANMVSEQRETIQRIDADTEDIALNVTGAQRELLKYYSRISSNRWLIIKSFGVILLFFFIWVLVS